MTDIFILVVLVLLAVVLKLHGDRIRHHDECIRELKKTSRGS